LFDVLQDENVVFMLFGIGQRWLTTPLPPILRFKFELGNASTISTTQLFTTSCADARKLTRRAAGRASAVL
jgi:hypothetical protein